MTTQSAADAAPAAILPPADAREVFEWHRHHDGLADREFVGSAREAAGFVVRVEGIQRQNGSCTRRISIEPSENPRAYLLEAAAADQLAAAITAATAEIAALR
ncbi:hypothetical protein [Mycolicibacterium iranicum]|uniref:Uncharacterized protein n=1 Tax=Mycolicibacterium iranicum TaxID=912594 RepID=A0ABT4HPZ6_MYCIR|nr:hypothetical protein [Mycolicibacterium iranicum]MCZ0732313.1 hypothetical protein [Mycolicibacterium iranicum]